MSDSETAVLDWRGPAARLAATLWDAGGPEGDGWRRALSALGAPLWQAGLRGRLAGRGTPPGATLVVSVGNLAVGGAGKTPVVAALGAELARRGHAGAIVTRGYGSPQRGPLRVRPGDAAAGDEARLLAERVPAWVVVQAADREAGVAAALADAPAPAIILLEDGHQSARAGRHLDVLILDRWRCDGDAVLPQAGPLLPWGPYREGPEGAARAACWLVEPPPQDDAAWLARAVPGGPWAPAAGAVLGFRRTMSLDPSSRPPAGAPDAALSGIARPAAFEAGCARLLGRPPRLAVRCDDHVAFTADIAARAAAAGRACGVAAWLVTEKDAVKLAPLWPGPEPLRIVRLDVTWAGKETLPDLVEERLASLLAGARVRAPDDRSTAS